VEASGLRGAVAGLVDADRVVSDAPSGFADAPDDLVAMRFTLAEPEIERFRALGRDAAEAVELACLATTSSLGMPRSNGSTRHTTSLANPARR
jgi:hypothetical protein